MTLTTDNQADRACQLTRELIGNALKVRDENPEYAQSPEQTAMILSMELGRLATALPASEQQQMVEGLRKGLDSLKLSETERQTVLNLVAPAIWPGFTG
ncbi:MAG: hypothetical protein OIF57_14445 [Marinobacterium sp.]|nr:hypothetical protein [Marinobacterium sp.]